MQAHTCHPPCWQRHIPPGPSLFDLCFFGLSLGHACMPINSSTHTTQPSSFPARPYTRVPVGPSFFDLAACFAARCTSRYLRCDVPGSSVSAAMEHISSGSVRLCPPRQMQLRCSSRSTGSASTTSPRHHHHRFHWYVLGEQL